MIITKYAILCLMMVFASAIKVEYKDCGSKQAVINSVEVDPCDNPKLCPLKKGTNPKISVSFNTKEEVTAVKAIVHGIIGGIPIPFGIPHPDGCTQSGLTCPIASGAAAKYEQQLEIKHEYPNLVVTVQWELQDQNNKDLVCFLVRTKIVD